MNTTKNAGCDQGRRKFIKGVFASAVLFGLPSCMRNSGPTVVSARDGRSRIQLFLGPNALSDDSLTNMRNEVGNLRGLLEKLMRMAEGLHGYRGVDFSGCASVARATLDIVDEFMRNRGQPAPWSTEFTATRWEFTHVQLLNAIRLYRDKLSEAGMSIRSIGNAFGVDLEDI